MIIDNISTVLRKVLRLIVCVIMLLMLLTALLQVFSRFIFNIGISWTEEVARTFFVYIIFIGIALVEADGSQTRITFLIDKLSRIPYFIWNTIILAAEITFIIFVLVGTFQVWKTAAQVSYVSFPNVTYRLLYIPFFIGMPICIWFLAMQEVELIKKTFGKKKQSENTSGTDSPSGKEES